MASAIWLRAALPVQRKRRRFFAGATIRYANRIMRKQVVLLAALACLLAVSVNGQDDPLAAARFLTGKWTYVNSGKAGEPTGSATFASSLGNRAIIRTSTAKFPAAAGNPAYTHEDLMVIHVQPGAVRADYYDNAGNVAHYTMAAVSTNYVVFTSDKVKGQPRARISYKQEANGTITVYAEAAAAADPDKFAGYAAWSMKK